VLETFRVPPDAHRERLDRVALGAFAAYPSRASTRKAAKRGELKVNGVPRRGVHWVDPGDLVERLQPEADRAPPLRIPLQVVHEDDHLAVVVKPGGLATSGPLAATVVRALPFNLTRSTAPDALVRPHPVHRLDAPTMGLLVVAKTAAAHMVLGAAFAERRVDKEYRALVTGRLEGAGELQSPIDGRAAHTRYDVLEHARSLHTGWVTRVRLRPTTGRKHQLRRHLHGAGHAVLGDRTYFGDKVLRGSGLYLFAVRLSLAHPQSGVPLCFEIPEPPKVASFLARETRRWDRKQENGERSMSCYRQVDLQRSRGDS